MKKINCEIENGIAQITMDDGKANAMDPVFFVEMGQALDQAEKDGTKLVVFTGRPGFFSGGLDLKYLKTLSPDEFPDFARTFAHVMLRIFALPIPTIAACSGHAIAGGAMLSFACDRRYIAEGPYKIQMNETLIGIPLPNWMLLIAGSAIPSQWLTEALLHARVYGPAEAVERNIFTALIKENDNILDTVTSLSEDLLALNLQAYATTKERMRKKKIERVVELLKEDYP